MEGKSTIRIKDHEQEEGMIDHRLLSPTAGTLDRSGAAWLSSNVFFVATRFVRLVQLMRLLEP